MGKEDLDKIKLILLATSAIASDLATISTEVQTLSTGLHLGTQAAPLEARKISDKASSRLSQHRSSKFELYKLTSQNSKNEKEKRRQSQLTDLGYSAYSEGGGVNDRDDSSLARLMEPEATYQRIRVTKSVDQTWEDGTHDLEARRWSAA
ncbi:MAG: hypothetical protein Q9165_003417 [Trypethelium subeluteriae]